MSFTINYLTTNYPFRQAIDEFLTNWENDQQQFEVQTSGSTGTPKIIQLSRKQLIASAKRTNDFFQLNPDSSVLMVLSPHTIAGKMMLIRALTGNYRLFVDTPEMNPLKHLKSGISVSLTSFVPAQVAYLIQHSPERLSQFNTILLGGAPLSEVVENQLRLLHDNVFMGFGMTETVSHIALRKLGKKSYTALEGVTISSTDNQLVINDQALEIRNLKTSDVIEWIDHQHFNWLGRQDFVINSGGIKLHPEQIEHAISDLIPGTFIIGSEPDVTFGERCIVIADPSCGTIDLEVIQQRCIERLGKHTIPRAVIYRTIAVPAGKKLMRKELLKSIRKND